MTKIDLIIDGNYFLYKVLFVMEKKKSLVNLYDYLINYYNSLSNIFLFNTKHFVIDGKKSWRYEIFKEYKAKRKKSEEINWEFVYQTFDEFCDYLKLNNTKTYFHNNLEGDDWIYLITDNNNHKNVSNLIISSDSDLFQLIKMNKSNWINIMWNANWHKEKWYIPNNYFLLFEKDETKNIFVNQKYFLLKNWIKSIIKDKPYKEIYWDKELFIKLLKGDKPSDNIPSIYEKKGRGLGEKKSEKFYNTYINKWNDVNFMNDEFIEHINELLEIDVSNNLKLNLKLIYLNKMNYDDELLNEAIKIL